MKSNSLGIVFFSSSSINLAAQIKEVLPGLKPLAKPFPRLGRWLQALHHLFQTLNKTSISGNYVWHPFSCILALRISSVLFLCLFQDGYPHLGFLVGDRRDARGSKEPAGRTGRQTHPCSSADKDGDQHPLFRCLFFICEELAETFSGLKGRQTQKGLCLPAHDTLKGLASSRKLEERISATSSRAIWKYAQVLRERLL